MAEHEIRVALVMNGGVSLAVWMAGVTHELDLIRRASTPGAPPAQSYDEKVAERWRLLLRPENGYEKRRLVIDVIAGTSAGGLNGVMLATTIAHDGTLDPDTPGTHRGPWLRRQWCQLGALEKEKLLPRDDRADIGSVLDGQFFLDEATKLLQGLAAGLQPTGKYPVTLFTTASGLGRQDFDVKDYAGKPFEVADHRFLYRFTTDLPKVYDRASLRFPAPADAGVQFSNVDTLARAARASASFPVAFEPVDEEKELNKVRPPRERPRSSKTNPSWLTDGGVLDNAPFGPVLETVARSEVESHTSRYLVYVVPSSGVGKATTAVDKDIPSWKQTAGSAIQFPREVDFRSDVEDLERLLLDADASWSDTQRLFSRACEDPAERTRVILAAEQLQPTYTRGRAAGGVWEAVTVSQSGRTTVLDRTTAVSEAAVAEILELRAAWTPPEGAEVVPTLPGPAGQAVWPWGFGPAERVARLILRRRRSRLAGAFEAARKGDDVPEQLLKGLEQDIAEASEVLRDIVAVRDAVTPAIKKADFTTAMPEADVTKAVNEIFTEYRVPEALGREVARLDEALNDGTSVVTVALATEIVSRCTSSRTPDRGSAPFWFVRLGPDVSLPILSAEDQALAADLGDRILYGTQVLHFGAFGAEEWREWDWLMGRLHAVAHVGSLMNAKRGVEAADQWVSATQRAVLAAEGWDEQRLVEQLRRMDREFPPGSGRAGLGRMLEALNAADGKRTPPGSSTTDIGDRLIHVSKGLGVGPGKWVKAAAGREDESATVSERLVRWFTEPTRTFTWRWLTAGRAQIVPTPPLLRAGLSATWWTVFALVGAALLVTAVLAGDASWWVVVLAGLGSAALVIGVALGYLLTRLDGMRKALASWVQGKVQRPPDEPTQAPPER